MCYQRILAGNKQDKKVQRVLQHGYNVQKKLQRETMNMMFGVV